MIAYDLQCPNNHRFEGWFEDSKTYERQRRQGQIVCPVCESCEVVRIPSTFAVKGVKGAAHRPPQLRTQTEAALVARALMNYVESNFDNVGPEFAREALKIHYGVTEPRNIRGTSTAQEEETLRQEGVAFIKVPLPDDSGTPSNPSSSQSDN